MLEERLSKEAESKERKRQQETQVMQRVEEEFQRKRAREKANIREQLRSLHHHQSATTGGFHHDGPLEKHRIDSSYGRKDPSGHPSGHSSGHPSSSSSSRLRLDPEGAPAVSHHRSSSDELQKENVKSNNLVNHKMVSAGRNIRMGEAQPHNNYSQSRTVIRESRDPNRREFLDPRLGCVFKIINSLHNNSLLML